MEEEIWVDVKGYEGLYQVSNLGKVKSLKRVVYDSNSNRTRIFKERILKPAKNNVGRLRVVLSKNNKQNYCQVHRLVLQNFIGECPENYEGCHNDGDCLNNKLENLRWDTHKNNEKDKIIHGTISNGEKHGMSKLTEDKVKEILELLKTKEYTQKEISEIYNVTQESISYIKNRKSWKHLNLE